MNINLTLFGQTIAFAIFVWFCMKFVWPPLTQAMQERQTTVGGERHRLPDPFFVLATQNPIEQEGTYPLPEAQLDRFLMEIDVDYPDRDAERRILFETTGAEEAHAKPSMDEIGRASCRERV